MTERPPVAGRQVPTAVVIGPESAGVMHADDLARDEGAVARAGRKKRCRPSCARCRSGTVELAYADAERTAAAASVWEQALESLRATSGAWGLEIEGTPRAEAERVAIEVRLRGLSKAVARYTEWAHQEAERRRAEPED